MTISARMGRTMRRAIAASAPEPDLSNVREMPTGVTRSRILINGKMIEISLDWSHVRLLALNASRNKSGKSQAGPVRARLVQP